MPLNRCTWLGFAALCLLSGSSWLLDESHPSELSAPRQLFVDHLLLATFFAVIATSRDAFPRKRSGWLQLLKLGLLSLFVIALPALLLPGSGVASTTSALIFLLVPAIVVFADSQSTTQTFGRDQSPFALLLPALAGLMGAGLILPFLWPAERAVQLHLLLLVASAIAAGVAFVRMHRLMCDPPATRMRILPALVSLCAFTALAAAPLALRSSPWSGSVLKLELLRCTVYSLPVLALTGWLLRELRPPAFAARAFFAVVITLVESYVMLRPQLTWPSVLGTALLLGGAIGLLRQDSTLPSFAPAPGAIDS